MSFAGDFLDRLAVRFKRGALPDDYRAVFDSDSGRRVLADLVRRGGMMVTHGGASGDLLQFEEGKRFMVLHILAMLRVRPQDLQRLADREVSDE